MISESSNPEQKSPGIRRTADFLRKHWLLISMIISYSMTWESSYGTDGAVSGWEMALTVLLHQSHYWLFFIGLVWSPLIIALFGTFWRFRARCVLTLAGIGIGYFHLHLSSNPGINWDATGILLYVLAFMVHAGIDLWRIGGAFFRWWEY